MRYTDEDFKAAEILLSISRSAPVAKTVPVRTGFVAINEDTTSHTPLDRIHDDHTRLPAPKTRQPLQDKDANANLKSSARPSSGRKFGDALPLTSPPLKAKSIHRAVRIPPNQSSTKSVGAVEPTLKTAGQSTRVVKGSAAGDSKRKRDEDSTPESESAASQKSAKIKGRREKHDSNSDKAKPESQQLGINFRHAMGRRSSLNNDYRAFADAVLPQVDPDDQLTPYNVQLSEIQQKQAREIDLGDPGRLHRVEQQFCRSWSIEYDTYRCQKYRLFLGLAFYTEFNRRKFSLHKGPGKFKVYNASKAQAQYFGNVDANKTSSMMAAFEHWGWVVPMSAGSSDHFSPPSKYFKLFPQELRNRLMDEVARAELEDLHPNQHVITRLMELERAARMNTAAAS